MITVNFCKCEKEKDVSGLWQYDYGQVLRIQGLDLPTAVEIHFSLQSKGGDSVTRVGVTRDGVTDVVIPDSMLENNYTSSDYSIYAFIYLTDETSGETVYKLCMRVRSRPKLEAFDTPEAAELFRDAIAAVNEAADRAEASESNAAESEKEAAEHLSATETLAEQISEDRTAVTKMTQSVTVNTEAVGNLAKQVEQSANDVSKNKSEVESLAEQVKNDAQQVSTDKSQVSSMTAEVESNKNIVQENANQVASNTEKVAENKEKVSSGTAKVEELTKKVEQYAEDTELSKNNAKQFEESAASHAANAGQSAEESRETARQAAVSEERAGSYAANAEQSANESREAARQAAVSEGNAASYAASAANQVVAAEQEKNEAVGAANNAKAYAEKAEKSEESTSESAEKAKEYMEGAKRNVQADMYINDETDPRYVKGRTHWSEGEQLVDIIPETTFEGEDVEQVYTQPLGLKAGETYIVKINGVTYENVAIEADLSGLGVNQIIVTDNFEDIGNMHYILAESPGGMDGVYAMLNVVPDGVTSHTVSVSCKSEVIHKLDNKFLDLDWLPVIDETEVLIAAKKTVTNHIVTPTETKGGFPDLTSSDVNEGDGLVVYFDGVRYPVTVTKITEISFAGNLYLISDQYPNTGEPFLLNFVSTRTNVKCDDNSHTASVYALIKNVNKLPEKFLPESVDSVILRSSTADSTKIFSLTVDDSGTIKATEITE